MKSPQTQTLHANALEITFLRQALTARKVSEQLDAVPQGEWRGLQHNHLCVHCDTTWRCDCDDGEYQVAHHGCDEQLAASKRLAIALRMPSKWDAPYLSRYAKPKRAAKGNDVNMQILANNAEIAKLKAALGISA